jgi:hypothetical protein
MPVEKIFPTVLILLDLGAGIVYVCGGDWKRMIYWTAAAILTATVTF